MPEELYPGHAAEHAAQIARVDAMADAAATPLPGPARDAFAPVARVVCGIEMQPVVASHVLFLQQTQNPLLLVAKTLMKYADHPADERAAALAALDNPLPGETPEQAAARVLEATFEAVFIFAQPPSRVRGLLRKGMEHFREAALAETLDRLPIHELDIEAVQCAVSEHFATAFSTVVQYRGKSGEERSFQSPPPAKTGSAGGLNSSAQ